MSVRVIYIIYITQTIFLNYLESELFYRNAPLIKNVSFVETRKKCYVFKIDEQSLQGGAAIQSQHLQSNYSRAVDLILIDAILKVFVFSHRACCPNKICSLYYFQLEIVLSVGHEKNVIYSKLVNNPFKVLLPSGKKT